MTWKIARNAAALISALAGSASTGKAQLAAGSVTMPDAPAFTYLGASPTKISRPSAARDLAVALGDGIDSAGRVRRGLAVDFALWPIIKYRTTDYAKGGWPFIVANTQISIGTLQASGDTSSTDLAIGIKTNLFNKADPLTDPVLRKTFGDINERCVAALRKSDGRVDAEKVETCADTSAAGAIKAWLKDNHWNQPSMSIGAAVGVQFDESILRNSHGRGTALWSTLGLPVASSGQLLLQTRYDWVRGGTVPDTGVFTLGGRLAFGRNTYNIYGEFLGSWRNKGTQKPHNTSSAGVEIKVAEKLWIATGFGTTYSEKFKGSKAVVLAGIHWNVSDGKKLE